MTAKGQQPNVRIKCHLFAAGLIRYQDRFLRCPHAHKSAASADENENEKTKAELGGKQTFLHLFEYGGGVNM